MMTEKLSFKVKHVRFELFDHCNIQQSVYRTLITYHVLLQTLKTQQETKHKSLFS